VVLGSWNELMIFDDINSENSSNCFPRFTPEFQLSSLLVPTFSSGINRKKSYSGRTTPNAIETKWERIDKRRNAFFHHFDVMMEDLSSILHLFIIFSLSLTSCFLTMSYFFFLNSKYYFQTPGYNFGSN
jgi:hypothetical protein